MPRYIDAERFSERFDMMCDAGGVLAPVTEAVREMLKKLIKAEPTVDAEPVRHGRWEHNQDVILYLVCSECAYYVQHEYKFCPNCGAKMDGGESDE